MNVPGSVLAFVCVVILSGEAAAASKTSGEKSGEASDVSALMAQLNNRGKSGVAWRRECVKWCKVQKLSQMGGLHSFTDSTGNEYKLGIGVALLRGDTEYEKLMARGKAQMSARSALLMARSNVSCTQTNTVTRTTTGKVVSRSSSTSMSWSITSNASSILETEVQDGAKRYSVVVMTE